MPGAWLALSYARTRSPPIGRTCGAGRTSRVATRSLASLSLSFGLVSIPVKVYAATESSAALRFRLLSRGGARGRDRSAPAVNSPAVGASRCTRRGS